ncbi:zinc finger protein 761-like [Notolabrus celidotus]|uniref:zinc finger protein 761-like n=1 Tax=Notolabrus celidotus TaxID=1203425 RepID=UPI00149076C1|nr:zinc finger protein 761-like [Notolabrus celidotus]
MCSVVGCDSWLRNAKRFQLPEDPERRLEWVRFLASVNKQRFKESSWTDITVCIEHFKDECFENHSGLTEKTQLALKPSAVPSLFIKAETDEPDPHLERPKRRESVEMVEFGCQRDDVSPCVSPTSSSEESGINPMVSHGSPVPGRILLSSKKPAHGQVKPKAVNFDLIREKAARLQMKGKYVVNEKRLLQLFHHNCPSCDCKLKMEKITYGLLIVLNQQCPQCEYTHQWKSQINANIPTDEDPEQTECIDVTPETQQVELTDNTQGSTTEVPEIVAVIGDESDHMEESDESNDQGDSDEDWKPDRSALLAGILRQKTKGEDETEDDEDNEEEEEEEEEMYPSIAPKDSQLCTDCGKFFNKLRPHTCEHKTKPFSCNICGKRFETEHALGRHSKIHDVNYEHRCKFCHVTFKTKADKFSHEHTHMTEGKPYKCPDCAESFGTNQERRAHIEDHRGPPQLKCDFCGIEFCWPLALRRHLAVHTGEKPHKCVVCQRGFNQASHLKSHMRLHTGERPFQCQYCDKRFNHNVSLKSHLQRYHTFIDGGEQNNDSINDVDAQEDLNRDAEQELGSLDVNRETEEEVQTEVVYRPKYKKKSTGRPVGRPKSEEANAKAPKQRSQKLKRTHCNEEEEDELDDFDISLDPTEDEEKKTKKVTKKKPGSRGRPKKSNGDKDYSSQNNGKSLAKRRGRPRKNPLPCSESQTELNY